MLSPLVKNIDESPTLWINQESNRLSSEGREIIRLGFGQSPFPVPEPVVNALKEQAFQKDYLPGKGLYQLRSAISSYCNRRLGLDLEADNISVGPGSKELIFGLQMAFDGDLILPAPSWVSYAPQSSMLGKKTWWVNTSEKDNWLLNPEELESVCKKITNPNKLLILNYPNNPTGTTFSVEQIKELVPVLRKYNVLLLADEIYSELQFADGSYSFAQYYPEGTIISSGLSKWCGAGGWRLGFFAFPKPYKVLQEAMASIASETFSAVSAPIQWAAISAYQGDEVIDDYLRMSRKALSEIAGYTHRKLTDLEITMPPGQGGFYLFPNFENHREQLKEKHIESSTDLCNKILMDLGIALLPGTAFGRPAAELTTRLSFVDFDGKALLTKGMLSEAELSEQFVESNAPKIKTAMERLHTWLYE